MRQPLPSAARCLEGVTLGPVVYGVQTLFLVSDNNFGATQFTQSIALALTPVPEPATAVLCLAGLAARTREGRRRCAGPDQTLVR